MNARYMILSLLLPSQLFGDLSITDTDAQRYAVEAVASISTTIADIVIETQNKEHNKNELKKLYVSLLTQMTDTIAAVIRKIKTKKATRAIDLSYDEETLHNALENITNKILYLIEQSEQHEQLEH